MSEPHAPDLVLRLSLPAARDFAAVAAEAAAKICEALGHAPAEARAAADTVAGLVADVAPDGAGEDITFEFHQRDGELRIEARCAGRSSRARHPLPT
jgi:hypothetical protein